MRSVSDKLKAQTQAVLDNMPESERAELREILHRTAHLLYCTPFERVPLPGPKHEDLHVWHRELAPDRGREGCICKPFLWNDCVV